MPMGRHGGLPLQAYRSVGATPEVDHPPTSSPRRKVYSYRIGL
jgi:hypothetical protein